jgi:hypothetical protein
MPLELVVLQKGEQIQRMKELFYSYQDFAPRENSSGSVQVCMSRSIRSAMSRFRFAVTGRALVSR